MRDFIRRYRALILLCLTLGCTPASCQSFRMGCTNEFGADWLLVQTGMDGKPIACWKLKNKPLDGAAVDVRWIADSGHIVYLHGWHNVVQVTGGDYAGAAKELGIDLTKCTGGRYE